MQEDRTVVFCLLRADEIDTAGWGWNKKQLIREDR